MKIPKPYILILDHQRLKPKWHTHPFVGELPSGKRLQFAIENCPVEIVDFPYFPMKNVVDLSIVRNDLTWKILWGRTANAVGPKRPLSWQKTLQWKTCGLRVRCEVAASSLRLRENGTALPKRWLRMELPFWVTSIYIYIAHKYLQYRQFLGISNKPSSILMPKNSPARVLVYSHSFNIPRSLRVLSESQNACRVDTNWCRSGRDRDMQIFCCANEARFMAVSATCGKELLQRHSKGNWRELNSW